MVSLAPWTCPSASSFSLLRRRSSPIPFAPLRDSLCAGPGLCSFQGALEEPRPSPVPGTSRVMRLRVRFPCFRYATNLALFPSASRILSPSPRIFRIYGEYLFLPSLLRPRMQLLKDAQVTHEGRLPLSSRQRMRSQSPNDGLVRNDTFLCSGPSN